MSDNYGRFNIERDCEKYGLLLKKSEQNKWQNKFCVLKDNFLFWYKEDDAIKIKKAKYFNMKPQGIIYLNNCIIREYVDHVHSFSFVIENCAFQSPVIFMTDSKIVCDMWMEKLMFNSNINHHNMLETQRFIKELMDTSSTLKYAKIKRLFDDAKYENETLLKLKEQLEKENNEKQKCLFDLQLEFTKVKDEVDEAYKVMNNLQTSKSHLEDKNLELESDLQRLDQERINTSFLLNSTNSKENEIDKLQQKLKEISILKEKIDQDRNDIKLKLSEKEEMSNYLEQENQRIINQAQELNNLIKKLKSDNIDIERKFEVEKAARIEAENRLQEADLSLVRLHSNIVEGGTKYTTEKKEEMTTDVNKLKDYFEEVIRAQSQLVLKRPLKKMSSSNDNVMNEEENISNIVQSNVEVMQRRSCTEDSTRVREQSQRVREEHRQRISVINWEE